MNWLNAVGDYIREHKSEIAFGAGVVLTGATTVLAVNATPKAMDAIEEKTAEKGSELTVWEKIKAGWKYYVLSTATEVLGLTCLFYGKSVDMKATGTALALADASQKLLKTYTEKVVEEIGEKKEEEVRHAAVEEIAREDFANYRTRPSEDKILLNGDSWYWYQWVGKKFITSEEKLKAALNMANEKINEGEDVALDDIFGEIYDASPVPINHDLFSDYGDIYGFPARKGRIWYRTDPIKIKAANGAETSALSLTIVNNQTWNEVRPTELY